MERTLFLIQVGKAQGGASPSPFTAHSGYVCEDTTCEAADISHFCNHEMQPRGCREEAWILELTN